MRDNQQWMKKYKLMIKLKRIFLENLLSKKKLKQTKSREKIMELKS
jgi:hypothetical protein